MEEGAIVLSYELLYCLHDRRALQSASTSHLVVLPIKLSTVGSRAFPVATAQVWNGLSEAVVSSSSVKIRPQYDL